MQDIQKDYETTKDIKPQSTIAINEEFSYKLFENNCVTWVIKKLSNIGIEIIDESYSVPGNFMEFLPTITSLHSTFLKFQNIDDNLKSVKGARVFMTWARTMMDNRYACSIDTAILDKKVKAVCQRKDEIFYTTFKQIYTKKEKLENIYSTLNKLLEKLIQRLKDTNTTYEKLKGDFEFIFWDKEKKQLKILDSTHNYKTYNINELDLSKPCNNFSASKFYPFIFIPKDEIISKILYHQYDYGKVSLEYQREMNAFYFTILAGERNDKFWSSSYHKMTKNLNKAYVS